MTGRILIYIAFVTSLSSVVLYYLSFKGRQQLIKPARLFFHGTVVLVIFAAAYLMNLILSHQFQYSYVYEYSDKDLGTALLVSTFYAGQEGSFFLWALFTSIVGVFVLNYVSKPVPVNGSDKKVYYEPAVMMMYSLVLAFLILLLILKSPFLYIWEKFPEQVQEGFIPQDGRGLNPILQNFWMVIHPPILFLGFTFTIVPFAFAISALLMKQYKNWISRVLPWALIGAGILGLGIILGGYWAYGVLGWGGYWAWDPVENSSFIPWLVLVAAVHTILAQRATGRFIKTNLVFSILAFLLVLYSTFLTRSGVLQNSSVHAFVEPGAVVYWALVIFILSFIAISVIALFSRLSDIKTQIPPKENITTINKGNFLFIGAYIVIALAAIIIAGTSMPIISKNNIDASFYNQMSLPVAVVILLIAAVTIYIGWQKNNNGVFLKKMIFPVVMSVIATVLGVILLVTEFIFIVLMFASFFLFFVSLQKIYDLTKKKKASLGSALGHIGLALFILGVIGSARYSQEKDLSLEIGKPMDAFGYKFTYRGLEEYKDPNNSKDQKYYLNILVEQGNKEMTMKPVIYKSSYMDNIIKNPDIASFASKDLYFSPQEFMPQETFSSKDLYQITSQGKQVFNFRISLISLDAGSGMMQQSNGGNFDMSAKLLLTTTDGKSDTIKLTLPYKDGEPSPQAFVYPKLSDYTFYLNGVKLKESGNSENTAEVAVIDKTKPETPKKPETLVAKVAIKPYINVLWTGAFLLVFGFFYAAVRRIKLKK
ncbi:MAG TPA: cytochrome c biogenesis protein CcsA [Ignavibacteria bacterium]|nr:cytochrome c biogenesis protein CcsA [Ignavibacteria bacterium]